uniref:DUF7695 domain-containing protein n=1 Tax=viral metagenome TaxID=1070528 RepID=A0A6M3L6Y3_9ZZZZ
MVCNTVLESKFTHDFQQCNCENETFVDGGNDYMRVGGIDWNLVEIIKEKEK